MCSPAAIPYIIAAVGAVSAGYQQKQQGKFAKDTARFNARKSENDATNARNKGVEEENRVRRSTAALQAKQRSEFAARGVDVESGSPLDIQEDTALIGEVDALRVREGFSRQGVALEDQATLGLAQGKAAEQFGENAFTGSLLTSSGKVAQSGVADKWFTPDSAANQDNVSAIRSSDFSNTA